MTRTIRIKHAIYAGVILCATFLSFVLILLSGKVFPYNSIEFGNWAMWVGAIGTIFAAIGTVSTLGFLIYQHLFLLEEKASKAEYDIYEKNILNLIEKLNAVTYDELGFKTSNSDLFKSIGVTYNNLLWRQSHIKSKDHRRSANALYLELSDSLKEFCNQVNFFDLYVAELPKDSTLRWRNNTIERCAEHLSYCWHKFIRPNVDFFLLANSATYGLAHYKLDLNDIYKILAILNSTSLELEHYTKVKERVNAMCKSGIFPDDGLRELLEEIPMLSAHLLLTGTLSAQGESLILRAYKPEQHWFVSEGVVKDGNGYIIKVPTFKDITLSTVPINTKAEHP